MSTAGEISGKKGRFFDQPAGSYERHADDWYIEPAWTVEALLRAEGDRLRMPVWDPACGRGTIPSEVIRLGGTAFGTDKVHRGFGSVLDFLAEEPRAPFWPARSIISNPPYGLAEQFALRAIRLAPYVALLVQAKFLYSQRRYALFTTHRPARIYHLSTRPTMPPGNLIDTVKAAGGKMDFAWMVFARGSAPGITMTDWLLKP